MQKKYVGLAVLLVLLVGGAYALHAWNGPDPEVIKIGFVGPLTGSVASIGESSLAGAELAVKELNDKGGLLGKRVELVVEDDRCSADGVASVTKLITVDKVVAISGPDCGTSGSAALPIAESKHIPVVIRWASAPKLAKIGDYIFRIYPSDAFQGKFVAEHIFNDLQKKKVAVLYVKNDWGQGIMEVFVERFKELGGEVVYEAGVLEDSRDIRSQLGDVKRSDADILFTPLYATTGAIGLKQAKELGLSIPIIGGDVFESAELQESAGAAGVQFSTAVMANPIEFQQKVAQVTGKDGSKVTAPLGYDSVMVIAEAIERAGSSKPEAIQKALTKTSYRGVSSPLIEFDADGDLIGAKYEIKTIR